jgi:hypothetical protein
VQTSRVYRKLTPQRSWCQNKQPSTQPDISAVD